MAVSAVDAVVGIAVAAAGVVGGVKTSDWRVSPMSSVESHLPWPLPITSPAPPLFLNLFSIRFFAKAFDPRITW